MSRSLIRPALAGTALALSSMMLSAAALAQQAPAAAPSDAAATTSAPAAAAPAERHAKPGKPGHHRGQAHRMRDGILIPGLGPIPKQLVEQLQLTSAQQKQLDETRASQREAGKAMHQARQQGRAALKAQLDAGKLDPRALLAQRETERERFEAGRKASQDRWLAVWDSLDASQQAKVAEFVKSHHDRRAERGAAPAKPAA